MNTNRGTISKRRIAAMLGVVCCVLGLALVLQWGTAVAQQPPVAQNAPGQNATQQNGTQETQPPERVARLIRDLGAESYKRRVAAGHQLRALGSVSIMPLELAKESTDPEVRIRANELLRDLKLAAMWEASTVTLHAEDRPVSEVFAEIARQTGNSLALGGGTSGINDIRVDTDFQNTPFWQVLDKLCASTGNHTAYFTGRRETRLGISQGMTLAPPVGYSGALRAKVLSVRRDFSEQLDFTSADSAQTHTFEIAVEVEWEEQFRMIAHHKLPRIIAAVTDTGEVLEAIARPDEEWVIANGLSRKATFTFQLSPPALAAARIARLQLAWEVAAVGDFAEVRIEELATSKVYEHEDVRVTLQSRVIRPYQRQELQVKIDRTYPDWQPAEMFYNEADVLLLDEDNQRLRLEQADWSKHSTGLKVRARYLGATAGTPKTLLVRYPRIRDKRVLELELNDIPLPRAVPK